MSACKGSESGDERLIDSVDKGNRSTKRKFLRSMTYRPQRIAETEAAVAKALITLSMDEREKVYEDIHGVAPVVDEDTECINDLLLQLDKKVQQNMTSIYKTALSMSKDYVEDPAFRLMFLRTESYDVSAACNRLMNFLEFKLTLFGQEKLTEDITLEDFGQEDIKMFESGMLQVLPEKDRAGRAVFCIFPSYPSARPYKTPDNLMRALFFMETLVVRHPAIQRTGAVRVFYNTNIVRPGLNSKDSFLILRLKQYKAATPLRYASYHTCLYDRKGIAPASVPASDVVRNLSHYGDDAHCLKELQRFGIPISCFPVDDKGKMNPESHQRWIEKVCRDELNASCEDDIENIIESASHNVQPPPDLLLEETQSSSTGSEASFRHEPIQYESRLELIEKEEIRQNDILLGRGKRFQNFPGNVQFRNYLLLFEEQYSSDNRHEKVCLTKAIADDLAVRGCRFIRLAPQSSNDRETWTEVGRKEVHKTISQCFRTLRKKPNAIYTSMKEE